MGSGHSARPSRAQARPLTASLVSGGHIQSCTGVRRAVGGRGLRSDGIGQQRAVGRQALEAPGLHPPTPVLERRWQEAGGTWQAPDLTADNFPQGRSHGEGHLGPCQHSCGGPVGVGGCQLETREEEEEEERPWSTSHPPGSQPPPPPSPPACLGGTRM